MTGDWPVPLALAAPRAEVAFVWQKVVGPDFADSPVLRDYFARVDGREAVRAALRAEGLS